MLARLLLAFSSALLVLACAVARPAGVHSDPEATAPSALAPVPSPSPFLARARVERPEHAAAKVPVSAADPQWGDVDAPVTIVEIGDFQCPFCARVQETLAALKREYGPRRLRLVWKHNPLPFHADARPAADVAAAVHMLAGSEAFFRFHDLAFAGQRSLDLESLRGWAAQVGVSRPALEAWLDSGRAHEKVSRDIELARLIGATGTPAFRINGVTLSGAQPYENFKRVVDAQLQAAAELVAGGTRRADVYAVLTARNFQAAAAEEAEQADTHVWNVPVMADDPWRGDANALVTLIVFSDFQCPFCKRVEPTLTELLRRYPRELRVVWKDNPLPFHERALPAALFARAAYQQQGNDGFWRLHDALFEKQPELEDADFQELARAQGLPWARVTAALARGKSAKIEQSQDLADDFEARGTPHFFINGKRLSGAQPLEAFAEVIEERLAIARALEQAGVPRSNVYSELMKDAEPAPEPERKQAPVRSDAAARGNAGAPVVIQQFSDFQCPFCKRVEPTLAQLEKTFNGSVRIVWRHLPLPFHEHARLAAEAAEEVLAQKGALAFWAYRDLLFEAQSETDGLGRESLVRRALTLGVDRSRFEAALDAHVHAKKVDADAALAASIGINGTPAFLINDYYLSGAQPARSFEKLIRRALRERGKRP